MEALKMKNLTILFVTFLCVAGLAAAEGKVEETREFSSRGVLSIENIAGSVTVIGWDKEQISIEADLGKGTRGLDISGDRDDMSIEVEIGEFGGHDTEIDMHFGDDDDDGDDDGDDDSDRSDRQRERDRRREEGRRERNERRHEGREHRTHSIEGSDLVIRVPWGARLEIETIAANIDISGMRGSVEAETVTGTIEITGEPERVAASAVSGNIDVIVDGMLDGGEFETVVGNVNFEADMASRGRFSFETVNGSIVLRLPSEISADFDISTFNGSINNEFGPRARKTSEYLNSLELSFSTGGGGARVSIETLNGNVKLVKN
jgi:hypothetical protein